MAWSLWMPAKVANVVPTLAAGGTLLADTTYYVRVQALDSTTSYRQAIMNWGGFHIRGPYSDVVSITTTATHRSIALTWDKAYKQGGSVEVDGYEVLSATSEAGLLVEHAKIASGTAYYVPASYTNAYTITVPAQNYYHRCPDGMPLLAWDGAGTATIPALHDWMIANGYGAFVKAWSTFGGDAPRIAYQILGTLKINPYASGYAFEMLNLVVWIFGALALDNCRVNWQRTVLLINSNSHLQGGYFNLIAATSTIQYCSIQAMFGVGGGAVETSFPTRSWGGGPTFNQPGPYQAFVGNQTAGGAGLVDSLSPLPFLRSAGNGSSSSLTPATLMSILRTGQHIISSDYVWNWASYSFCFEQTNAYAYWQVADSNLIDCVLTADNYNGRSGTSFDQWITWSGSYNGNARNVVSALNRRIRVRVLDEFGDPVQGATVRFTGAGGQNLAQGNTLNDVVRLRTPNRVDGVNWQLSEAAIQHDASDVWLERNTANTGPLEAVVGQEYWWRGERLKLVEKLADAPPYANYERWRTERGLTNTQKGWLNNIGSYFIRAPQAHTTDAQGEVLNITPLLVVRCNQTTELSDYSGWLFNLPPQHGTLHWYAPVTVRVEMPGYDAWEGTYDINLLAITGVKPFVVVAQLVPVTPPVYIQQNISADVSEQAAVAVSIAER